MERVIQMNEVVANAATIIPEEDREARNLMRQWAYLGARELLSNKADIETEEITISNLLVPKPKYHISTIDLSFFDVGGLELHYRFQQGAKDRIHTGRINSYRDDSAYPMLTVSEQSDAYVLDSYYGDQAAQAFIRYYKLPIDSLTDEPYFYSEQLLALMMFIRWMWFLRKNDPRNAQIAKQDWMQEQHKVKTRNKMPDGLEAKEIARTWNSMIQKKFYNTF